MNAVKVNAVISFFKENHCFLRSCYRANRIKFKLILQSYTCLFYVFDFPLTFVEIAKIVYSFKFYK